jgi:hypothetical protein
MFTDAQRAKGRAAVLALGRLKPGEMNRLEAAYDLVLRAKMQAGEIAWYKFHGIKLRLADNTFYEPDFAVMRTHGLLEMHETKGFMMGDARTKIAVAAALYPFRFLLIKQVPKKAGGGWSEQEF